MVGRRQTYQSHRSHGHFITFFCFDRRCCTNSIDLGVQRRRIRPRRNMITAGSDGKLRFWDLGKPEKSLVFSVPPRVGSASSLSSSFTSTASSSRGGIVGNGAMLSIEPNSTFRTLPPPPTSSSTNASPSPTRIVHSTWYPFSSSPHSTGEEDRTVTGTRLKSPLLANQTAVYAGMARAHKDAIMDVVVIEAPFRCVVAADRSGCIRSGSRVEAHAQRLCNGKR